MKFMIIYLKTFCTFAPYEFFFTQQTFHSLEFLFFLSYTSLHCLSPAFAVTFVLALTSSFVGISVFRHIFKFYANFMSQRRASTSSAQRRVDNVSWHRQPANATA